METNSYKKLLVNFMLWKNKHLHRDSGYFTKKDSKLFDNWTEDDCHRVAIKIIRYCKEDDITDSHICPFCLQYFKVNYHCHDCEYGIEKGECTKNGSIYQNIINILQTNNFINSVSRYITKDRINNYISNTLLRKFNKMDDYFI